MCVRKSSSGFRADKQPCVCVFVCVCVHFFVVVGEIQIRPSNPIQTAFLVLECVSNACVTVLNQSSGEHLNVPFTTQQSLKTPLFPSGCLCVFEWLNVCVFVSWEVFKCHICAFLGGLKERKGEKGML